MRKRKICCLQDRSHNSRTTAYPNTHHIHSVSVKWRWFKYLCGGNSIYASCGCNDSCSTYGTAEKTDQMHNLRCFCSAFDILFVDRMYSSNEFMLWSVPTIFGLSIILFPFVIRGIELPPVLSDKKALITMLWDTLWLFLTIIEVCGHTNDVAGMKAGCIIAFVFVLAAWLIFSMHDI